MFFLVFAALIWYGYSLNTVRERGLVVPIEYSGVPDNIAFEQPLPDCFYITVRDEGKRLKEYKSGRLLPMQIDLTKQIAGERGTVHINSDQVRQQLSDQLQGTAKIQYIRPEVIQTDYYRQSSKRVGVVLQGEITPAQQYRFTQEPTLNPKKIVIYGKKEALDTISQVLTKKVERKNVKDTLRMSVELQDIENIRLSQDTVALEAVAEQFTEKRMTLPLQTRNVPRGEKLRLFPSTVDVLLQVNLAYFSRVTENTVAAYCNYPRKTSNTLTVELQYDKSVVSSAKAIPQEVEFIIEK